MKVALLAPDRFPIIPPFSGGLECYTGPQARHLIHIVMMVRDGGKRWGKGPPARRVAGAAR